MGVADGAPLLGAGKPLDDVEVAGVGGDGDEEPATDVGCSVADQRFGEECPTTDRLLVVGDTEAVEELVHEEHVVVPFGAETFVAVVEVEHRKTAVVEAAEVACPDELFFAFLAEVDAVADMSVCGWVGERTLDGEVGYLAAAKEVQHLSWMGGTATVCCGIDTCHGNDSVEHGRQGVDDFACVAFHRHMGGMHVGMLGFDL